jgi:hypothetical protein
MVFLLVPVLADSDPVMGIWEGTYTSESGDSGPLAMKIIALGKGKYVAVIELSDRGRRAELPGQQQEAGAAFHGSIDLGEDLGGSCFVKVLAAGPDIEGTYAGTSEKGTVRLKKATKKSPTLGASPPDGALVLFDGSGLEQWKRINGETPTWKILGSGAMEVVKGNIITIESFGDAKVHLEFRTPFMPEARGQARGNSGVYVQGRYEAQILDSFGLEPLHHDCGGIYEIADPIVNACLPPLDWQTYDIEFLAPRFDVDGKKTADAVMTVRLNGILVHDEVKVPRPTRASIDSNEVPKAGLMLQDHGNPVQYRNIWILPMNE